MAHRRLARLNEQIRREVSEILRTAVRDPRVGLPTVTAVNVTADLWMARVFVRPDPTKSEVDLPGVLEALERAAPFIRRELGKALRARRVPELRFEPDVSMENASRIERILQEVLPRDSASTGEGREGSTDETESPPEDGRDVEDAGEEG
jgi:ribosome-binding factor A